MQKYITIQGDMFDSIAKAIYSDGKRMDALLTANPEHMGIVVFSAGVALNIPTLLKEAPASDGMPPWRAKP